MTKAEAVLAAAALRHELGLGTDYVDVFDVVRRQGIELYLAPFGEDSLEGAHLVQDSRAFIFVNTSSAITRQRLTAAHELGHHVLEDEADGSVLYEANVTAASNDPKEWAAYAFARYFLMDPEGVRRLAEPIDDADERVAAVASRFVTSIDATCIHLTELGVITAAAKNRILERLRTGEIKPAAFLRGFGYHFEPTPKAEGPRLDPRFVRAVIDAYSRDWITFVAFADIMQLDPEEAAGLLAEHGLTVRNLD
jgi:Zn-dependent peptidase ImmA (M78 family)